MLSTGEIWNPTDLIRIDMPDDPKQKQINQAIAFLRIQGVSVS